MPQIPPLTPELSRSVSGAGAVARRSRPRIHHVVPVGSSGGTRLTVGRMIVEEVDEPSGVSAARPLSAPGVGAAKTLREQALADDRWIRMPGGRSSTALRRGCRGTGRH